MTQNGYSQSHISKALGNQLAKRNMAPEATNQRIEPIEKQKIAYFPYIKGISDKIIRVLKRHKIRATKRLI